jgi:DNA-binding response OmpR family regulator
MRILCVDDEANLRKHLKAVLEAEYFSVDTADDGERAAFLARTQTYDLVILDNVMPYKTGIEVCRELRQAGKTVPILVLSAVADTQMKIQLLNAGADDYMIKPFSSGELVARAKALLRRKPRLEDEVLAVGDLKLDTKRHTVTRNKKTIELRPKEYELLEYLMLHEGIALTRQMLLEHVWDMNVDLFTNTIEAHIRSLRQKLGKPDLIHTIHGAGYKIAAKR